MGQVQVAERLGLSLNRLNEIVLGKRGITADTALWLIRLEIDEQHGRDCSRRRRNSGYGSSFS